MAFINEKTVASYVGNFFNTPLRPEYAFKSAQQSFRFVLQVSGIDIAFVKDVKRPSVSIEYKDYDYLGYQTKFPSKIKWESVSFNVIESYDERMLGTVLSNLLQKFQTSAYSYPTDLSSTNFKNLSKKNLTENFGSMVIRTIDPDGAELDSWKLWNPMISKITPSQLQYSDDNLTSIGVEVVYDWAEYNVGSNRVSGILGNLSAELVRRPLFGQTR
jgi:hypothetical protein